MTSRTSIAGKAILGKPSDQDVNWLGNRVKRGVKLWPIGTDTAGQPVYLEFDAPKSGPCMAMINDQPITFMDGMSVKGVFQVNISTLLLPGAANRIEIWPNESIVWSRKPSAKPASIVLQGLRVGIGE